MPYYSTSYSDRTVDRITPTHSNSLERAMIVKTINTAKTLGGPVWPVQAGNSRRPKNASSGGTPSELARLGLLWGRQATQNVFKAVETKEESNVGLEKARVWEIKSNAIFVLIRLGITSIGLSLYIYRLGKSYPFSKSVYTRISKIKWNLLGLQLDRPVRPVGL